jgi:hypothetical protein
MAIFNTVYGGELKWTPSWAIAYFPFETDMVDALGNKTITVTATWVSIATTWWVSALYNNGSGAAKINVWFRKADVTSLFMWVKPNSLSWVQTFIWERSTSWGDQDRGVILNWSNFEYVRYQSWWYWFNNISASTSWACIWVIEKSDWCDLYINWTKYNNWTQLDFSILTADVWLMCRYNNWSVDRKFNWYLSKLALYDKTITEDKYMLYYNSTKANYS